MYLRWQSRKRKRVKFGYGDTDIHWRAILIENRRVHGKLKQHHVAYLIGFTESQASIVHQRCHLWDDITERLDKLKVDNRAEIEAKIAVKLPRPTRAEYKKVARDIAKKYGYEYLPERMRALVKETHTPGRVITQLRHLRRG
jgi:hypothetical protein